MNADLLLRLTGLTLALISFSAYARVIRTGFDRPDGVSWSMRSLAACGSVLAALTVVLLLWAPAPALWGLSIGVASMAAGLALFRWTRKTLRDRRLFLAFTPTAPTLLVTDGPWRWIRHPHYTSYLLTWVGCGFVTMHPALAVGIVIMLTFYAFAARSEECALLRGPLGPQYARYHQSTGMFMPIPWRARR